MSTKGSYKGERLSLMDPNKPASTAAVPKAKRTLLYAVLGFGLVVFIIVAIVASMSGASDDGNDDKYYVRDESFGVDVDGMTMSMAVALGHPQLNDIYFLMTPNLPIYAMSISTGEIQYEFGEISGIHSGQCHFDENNTHLWVADEDNCVILKYDGATGELLDTIGDECGSDLEPVQFDLPTDVVQDNTGSLYITDGEGQNHRLLKLNAVSHEVIWAIGAPDWVIGDGDGEFNFPHSVAWDSIYNRVWVADRYNDRIQVFDADSGEFLAKFGCELISPTSVRINAELGLVYLLDAGVDNTQDMGHFYVGYLPNEEELLQEDCDQLIIQRSDVDYGAYPHQISYDTTNGDVYFTSFWGVPDWALRYTMVAGAFNSSSV